MDGSHNSKKSKGIEKVIIEYMDDFSATPERQREELVSDKNQSNIKGLNQKFLQSELKGFHTYKLSLNNKEDVTSF